MGKTPPIVVQRRSFGSSLVLGVFGTICVTIVCVAAVVIYGLKIVDDKIDDLIAFSPHALSAVTSWQETLPPALTDTLHDRRAPEYRSQVQVKTELVRDWKSERQIPVIEVTNDGDQVISLMSIRLQIEDPDHLPLQEFTVYAATPFALESDWRGPLLPGSTRKFRAGTLRADVLDELAVSWEICELRVWDRASHDELQPPALDSSLATDNDEPSTAVPGLIDLEPEPAERDVELADADTGAAAAPSASEDTQTGADDGTQ